MDSGCEVVLVDVNVATTNGINGTNGAHEAEAPEMKTRSKVAVDAGDDESAKPKIRLTRTTVAPKSADDKDTSDGEKKEKKKSVRSGAGDAEEAAAGAKAASKEPAPATNDDGAASAKAATGATAGAGATVPAPSAIPKKKALERDNDSGINSRASSVSNDDIGASARMRTRSSRAPETAASTSVSGRTGAAARVPIAIYEFDAASFDDDLPIGGGASTSKGGGVSSAQKRKAVYIEEMEDDEDEEEDGADNGEPVAKRRAAFLVSAGAGIVTSLLYPLRKLRSGIAAVRPFKAQLNRVASVEVGEEEDGAGGAIADDAAVTSSPGGCDTVAQSSDQQPSGEAANTCSLM